MFSPSPSKSAVNIRLIEVTRWWYDPGGTFVFEVERFAGDRGIGLVGSLSVSMVSGLELTIASTSATSVRCDHSLRLVPWFFSIDDSIFQHDRICRSQITPMWLAAGGFFEKVIQSVAKLANKKLILLSSIMVKACFNSFSPPTKSVPLSRLINLTLSPLAMNLLSHCVKQSVSIELTTSKWTTLQDK